MKNKLGIFSLIFASIALLLSTFWQLLGFIIIPFLGSDYNNPLFGLLIFGLSQIAAIICFVVAIFFAVPSFMRKESKIYSVLSFIILVALCAFIATSLSYRHFPWYLVKIF